MSTYLNIGCGPVLLPNHVNVDRKPWSEIVEWAGGELILPEGAHFLQHDCITDMPFDDGTIAGITADNVLEHLSVCYGELQAFLGSAWRILEPGGYLTGIVPDYRAIVLLWLENSDWAWDTDAASGAYQNAAENALANFAHGWEHKAIFDAKMLTYLLERSGYERVTVESEGRMAMRFRAHRPGCEASCASA